jgi:hypothetical protein
MEKVEKIVARVVVDRCVWRCIKAKAVLRNKTVAEYVEDILKKEVGSERESNDE